MKRREKERKGEKKRDKISRVNYHQSTFNLQKEKLNILAKMFEISQSGLPDLISYIRAPVGANKHGL